MKILYLLIINLETVLECVKFTMLFIFLLLPYSILKFMCPLIVLNNTTPTHTSAFNRIDHFARVSHIYFGQSCDMLQPIIN